MSDLTTETAQQKREAMTEVMAGLLALHGDYHVNDDGWTVCLCGHVAEGDDDDGSHARHVAAVLVADGWRHHPWLSDALSLATAPSGGTGYCPDACTWPHEHRFERDGTPWPGRHYFSIDGSPAHEGGQSDA